MSSQAKIVQPELTMNTIIYYLCIILTDFLRETPGVSGKGNKYIEKFPNYTRENKFICLAKPEK